MPSSHDTPSIAYHALHFTRYISMQFDPEHITRYTHHPLYLNRCNSHSKPLQQLSPNTPHVLHPAFDRNTSSVTYHHPVTLQHHKPIHFAGYLSHSTPRPSNVACYIPAATHRLGMSHAVTSHAVNLVRSLHLPRYISLTVAPHPINLPPYKPLHPIR